MQYITYTYIYMYTYTYTRIYTPQLHTIAWLALVQELAGGSTAEPLRTKNMRRSSRMRVSPLALPTA